MRGFQFHAPDSLAGVHALLAEFGYDAKLLSGGTSLLQFMKQQLVQPDHVVSLGRVPGLEAIDLGPQTLRVGGRVVYRDLERDAKVAKRLPLLNYALAQVATMRIREMATVGGALGQADPAQDLPGVWLALDAKVHASSARAERDIPIESFFEDYYTSALEPDEAIVGLTAQLPAERAGWSYQKFLPRSEDDYAAVSVAALVTLGKAGEVDWVRLALGSVGSTPILATPAMQMLLGQKPTPDALAAAAATVAQIVDPLDDVRGGADYKRDMAVVFIRRALQEAIARAKN